MLLQADGTIFARDWPAYELPQTDFIPPQKTKASIYAPPLDFRTVVISDTHLGRAASFAEYLLEFLQNVQCQKLVINGDFIDGWHLNANKREEFPELHKRCLDAILAHAAQGTEVIWVRGNHDENIADPRYDLIDSVIDFKNRDGNLSCPIKICRRHVHEDAKGNKALILHGDDYDQWQTQSFRKKLAEMADIAYEPILRLSQSFRKAAINWTGLDISPIAPLKIGSKWLVGAVKGFEKAVAHEFETGSCDIVICGHIHKAEISHTEKGRYMNSGDWVESGTALGEAMDGNWRVVDWSAERKNYCRGRLPSENDTNKNVRYREVTERAISLIHRVWPGNNHAERINEKRIAQFNLQPQGI